LGHCGRGKHERNCDNGSEFLRQDVRHHKNVKIEVPAFLPDALGAFRPPSMQGA
jgi:hypothetical protein